MTYSVQICTAEWLPTCLLFSLIYNKILTYNLPLGKYIVIFNLFLESSKKKLNNLISRFINNKTLKIYTSSFSNHYWSTHYKFGGAQQNHQILKSSKSSYLKPSDKSPKLPSLYPIIPYGPHKDFNILIVTDVAVLVHYRRLHSKLAIRPNPLVKGLEYDILKVYPSWLLKVTIKWHWNLKYII